MKIIRQINREYEKEKEKKKKKKKIEGGRGLHVLYYISLQSIHIMGR